MTASAQSYRLLPAVDRLLAADPFLSLLAEHGEALVLAAIRADLEGLRGAIREGLAADEVARRATEEACAARVSATLRARTRATYVRALNATGVVLHTGLGRAPLAPAARAALDDVSRSYAVLEVERASGKRNERDDGIVRIVEELTGADGACVVNNNAGATLIALAALAKGRPVVVSRGQLVEIGGSFRIPDVMAESGARMVEVGATNRTHLRDYERALDAHPDAALLLRVHASNYRVVGFTQEVSLEDLVALGRARGVEVMDDLGSGCFFDLGPYGLPQEPLVQDSLKAGAGVATFSGDKLLGGPQAGIIVGKKELIRRIRKHPLYRALRPDKLILAALEATLALYRDLRRAPGEVPTLRMLGLSLDDLERRAQALAAALRAGGAAATIEVRDESSRVGGGSYAIEQLPTRVVAVVPERMALEELVRRLRLGEPCVFARIQDGALVLDPRTLLDASEDREVADAVLAALR